MHACIFYKIRLHLNLSIQYCSSVYVFGCDLKVDLHMLHPCIILQNGEKLKVVGHFTLYFSMLFCWFVASSIYVCCMAFIFKVTLYFMIICICGDVSSSIIYFYSFLTKVKHNPIEIMITLPMYCEYKKCERESYSTQSICLGNEFLITFLQHNVAKCVHQIDFNILI